MTRQTQDRFLGRDENVGRRTTGRDQAVDRKYMACNVTCSCGTGITAWSLAGPRDAVALHLIVCDG